VAEIFADVDSPIALEFLDRYPTPQSASAPGEKRLAAFMARHASCGRRTVAELLERLRAAPRSAAGELEAEAQGECVRALVAVLRPLVAQIATLSAAVQHAVDAHPDGKIVTSLFRKGRVCAATLLAEIGDDRARFVSGATCACARRSSHSLTPRATPTRGPARSTSRRATEAASTPTRFASSPVPGVACSGPAGRSARHTTRPSIAPPVSFTLRLVDQEAA
jgi:hypothetical protein